MAKYKIIYDRDVCIGAYACAAASPDLWLFADDGKADLKGAVLNEATKKWEIIVDEADFDDSQAAMESCPVYAIKIVKLDDKGNEIPVEKDEKKA
jgi:ferredoxin